MNEHEKAIAKLLEDTCARKINIISDGDHKHHIDRQHIDFYSVDGKTFAIHYFKNGFEVYIPISASNRIDETMDDLKDYLK